jgi:hypothetical protein
MSELTVYNPDIIEFECVTSNQKSLNDFATYPMSSIAPNTATTLTQVGQEGKSWYVCYANWRVSGTAAVGATNLAVTIKDGANTIYASAIPGSSINGTSLHISLTQPIKITTGNAVTYSIATPGAVGCIIYANIGLFLK